MAQLKANPPATGYLIESITPDSQATKLGLQVGDIITTYNNIPIKSGRDLRVLPKQVETEMAPMTVYQGVETRSYEVSPKEPIGINGSYVKVQAPAGDGTGGGGKD
jgi:S1-C subfamily serine protease